MEKIVNLKRKRVEMMLMLNSKQLKAMMMMVLLVVILLVEIKGPICQELNKLYQ